MTLKGKIWKVGDSVDTDMILPGQYLSLVGPKELAEHCMEGIEPNWAARLNPGDILIAGKNFGCGSSREHAPLAMKGCGLGCVVAESFGAIFYRNAINVGLPVVEVPGIAGLFAEGEKISVDIIKGRVINESSGQEFEFSPMPEIILEILTAGGLLEYISGK
jgi:3-isopropylmalate/(R)-2-methylmalate dehydratase small subunit